ncbi:carbonate dehydratase [Pseudoalteromonas sp. SSM20]|uniref:carbonate dehydratase n=1 Tax=Pseudoalteromonas sp. SSM20 TaxID=3139394 RepID=UPI003BAC5038
MYGLDKLFTNNEQWVSNCTADNPEFFHDLASQQTPEYLWIGCADSRVPANQIVGLKPGELFVHRNIANLVHNMDYNCMSVVQYAVEVLKVKHIIVTGHYGCGGVQAAMDDQEHGLVDNWLRSIKDVYTQHREEVERLRFREQRINRLCELNVIEQVKNLSKSKILLHAWQRQQDVSIHGMIYSICDGRLKNLNVSVNSAEHIDRLYNLKATTRENRPEVQAVQSCAVGDETI